MLAEKTVTASHAGEDQSSAPAAAPVQCWSTTNEQFDSETLSGLIIANDWLRAGDIVYVGDRRTTPLSELCDADDIIEIIRERASDIAGEGAEDYPDVTESEKKMLAAAVHGWIALCCAPTFWGVENVRRHTLTDADLDAAARAVIEGVA